MLTIRTAQLAVLSRPMKQAALVRQARTAHAARAAGFGPDALESLADTVLQRCLDHRIEVMVDQLRVMDLTMIFGPDWHQPDLAWLAEGLADPTVPDPRLRVRRLWRRALRQLARRA